MAYFVDHFVSTCRHEISLLYETKQQSDVITRPCESCGGIDVTWIRRQRQGR